VVVERLEQRARRRLAVLDANLDRCARLRQAILERAFSGRLVRPRSR
jgi:hypothetical protein